MNRTLWILVIVLGLLAPSSLYAKLGLDFGLYDVFAMKMLCFAMFAMAFNLLLGYGGLLSFGHAAFFGGASYITAFLVTHGLHVPTSLDALLDPAAHAWVQITPPFTPELGILAGAAFAAFLGWGFGAIAIRRQGIYFAMITLALAQIVYFMFLKAPFTHGEDGLHGVPRGEFFGIVDLGSPMGMYYTTFAIFLGVLWLIARVVDSPFGQVLKSIRENEPRALSLGYDVAKYKHAAFVMSASLAGVAGATKSIVFQNATLTDVTWHMSGEVILMTLLGGMGTILGPVVGSMTVVALQSRLSGMGAWVTVLIGLTFIACVLLFRRGFVGELIHLIKHRIRGEGSSAKASTVSGGGH